MALQAKISEELNIALEGERSTSWSKAAEEGGVACGRSYREAPDVDGRVYVENAAAVPGEFVRARVVQGFAYDLVASESKKNNTMSFP